MENKKVSSAINLNSLLRPFGKSLTYLKKKEAEEWDFIIFKDSTNLERGQGDSTLR